MLQYSDNIRDELNFVDSGLHSLVDSLYEQHMEIKAQGKSIVLELCKNVQSFDLMKESSATVIAVFLDKEWYSKFFFFKVCDYIP